MKAAVAVEDKIVRVLGEGGEVDASKDPRLSDRDLLTLYRAMLLNRMVDERMFRLQRQGRIAFYIGATGEEAAIIGAAFAMGEKDWVVPCYREFGAAYVRGFTLRDFFCQIFGNAQDLTKGRQMPVHIASSRLHVLSVSSPVGTQIPHAVGLAIAAKIRKAKEAALVFFGDGATSEGDFHVSMNFAGVFRAPCVFLCRNNQWAISVPRERQTAAPSIEIKAKAYGFEGVLVDGNDVLAIYATTKKAFEKARSGGGPTLIEAFTYRLGPHSTSDDPHAYRGEDEVELWKKKDPLIRFREYLEKRKLWHQDRETKLMQDLNEEILSTLKEVEQIPPPPPESIFEDVYAVMPWHLREQRDQLLRWLEERKKITESY
ncbi:MAG: pyruvate dehydrogenase (acetyl-transferring) E1 component subunit alpha [Acidobacteria bacterium]|nr:pyruvate dehydrogenase (acetyl-transferring) E1 component subunit alpha [Acidobacteriota bacterium]